VLALAVAVLIVGPGRAAAQPTKLEDAQKKLDQNNPVPADGPHRRAAGTFAVPALNRKMFAEIEEFKPVASEAQNPLEYLAWCEVVSHAKKFATADLEEYAARDLTPLDLLKVRGGIDPTDPNKPRPSAFRCELVRFDGKLTEVRRLDAPQYFKTNKELGVAELYEARLVPVDESPHTPVSIVFTDLPAFLNPVLQKPRGEWLTVPDQWVTAAGYFFKTMSTPGEQANEVVGVPVLIGKSVTPRSGPPEPQTSLGAPGATPGGDPTALDRNVRVYKFIRDKTKVAGRPRLSDPDTPWEEAAAYDRIVRHAARFPAEELERHARADLKFPDLFEDTSASGYRLQLIKLEGRLISLRRFDPAAEIKSAGAEDLFEGWLVPANEPRGNPVCIVFTEPLAGVEPAGRVNKWVSFAGYSFKKMLYKSAEQDPENPARNLNKYAPLLIGRSPIARRDPEEPTAMTWGVFVRGAIVAGVLLIGAAGVLTWYYRRGDRRAKEAMDAVRHRNPFDPNAADPTARANPSV
jgi:hypothetical protein